MSESTLVKMSHCSKSHVTAQLYFERVQCTYYVKYGNTDKNHCIVHTGLKGTY